MRIYKQAIYANDLAEVYDGLKKAMKYIERNSMGMAKKEIRDQIKNLELIRPHLRHKDAPVRRRI